MASAYKLLLAGVVSFLVFGAAVAVYGYQTTIYPIDKAIGYLERAQSSQTPEEIASYVQQAKELLPKSGNPVWSFPTARTDFGLIQNELDNIVSRSDALLTVATQSADYNTGLTDIHESIQVLENNLTEGMPYLFVSFTNIILSAVWIAVIFLIFAVMRRGRARFKEEYKNQ